MGAEQSGYANFFNISEALIHARRLQSADFLPILPVMHRHPGTADTPTPIPPTHTHARNVVLGILQCPTPLPAQTYCSSSSGSPLRGQGLSQWVCKYTESPGEPLKINPPWPVRAEPLRGKEVSVHSSVSQVTPMHSQDQTPAAARSLLPQSLISVTILSLFVPTPLGLAACS